MGDAQRAWHGEPPTRVPPETQSVDGTVAAHPLGGPALAAAAGIPADAGALNGSLAAGSPSGQAVEVLEDKQQATNDDFGRATFTVEGVVFEVPRYLTLLRLLGRGTYGVVAAFRDERTGEEVAVKKIPNPLKNVVECKRCLREIKLLRLLQHEGVIPLRDLLPVPAPCFLEVYLVTELMDADLHTVITSGQHIGDDHVQFFIYQIILALQYLHSANVVHRDLKPQNVLVNQNCDVKLCDFGLARGRAGFSQEDDDFLRTEYVGTRWYRAPEVVLTSMEYTAAVDMWSVGCIFGELLTRAPIFRGSDFLDQIRKICEVLGTPSDSELAFIPQANEAARAFIKTRFPSLPRQSWAALCPGASPEQCKLLDQMLQFDPGLRPTAGDALRHAYLADQFCEEDEVLAESHVDWSFDDECGADALQSMIYHEVAAKHPSVLERDHEDLLRRRWLAGPATGADQGLPNAQRVAGSAAAASDGASV